MRSKHLPVSIWTCALVFAAVLFYADVYDDTEFSSTLQLSYALSQSVQIFGPVAMGISALAGWRQHRLPDRDVIETGGRGLRSFRLASIAWLTAWIAFAYSIGCAVVLVIGVGGGYYNNGLTLRIVATLLGIPFLVVLGYTAGYLSPYRITPALAAVVGYFVLTEPIYWNNDVEQLAFVQQANFTALADGSLPSSLMFCIWMLALSGLALAAYLHAKSRVLLGVMSTAMALACVVALGSEYWKPVDEFSATTSDSLVCAEADLACVFPAYEAALPAFAAATERLNQRLEQVGLMPIMVEQTRYALGATRDSRRAPIDVYSTKQDDVRVSLFESVLYSLNATCVGAGGAPAEVEAFANWLASDDGENKIATRLREVGSTVRIETPRALAESLGCL